MSQIQLMQMHSSLDDSRRPQIAQVRGAMKSNRSVQKLALIFYVKALFDDVHGESARQGELDEFHVEFVVAVSLRRAALLLEHRCQGGGVLLVIHFVEYSPGNVFVYAFHP